MLTPIVSGQHDEANYMKPLKYYWLYFIISSLLIIPGMISLFMFGLKPSVDFVGGSLWEIRYTNPVDNLEDSIRSSVDNIEIYSIQSSGDNQVIIKLPYIENDAKEVVRTALIENLGDITELRFESVGPTLSQELLNKTISGVILVAIIIAGYVWYRFRELKFGICAILAMFHDTFVLLGIFSLLGHFFGVEVDVLFVTAVLTTLTLSVHDTIVVFDRIRELTYLHPNRTFAEIANAAVVETFCRSLNNSITIILMLTALFLLGGITIRYFSLALLIGAITGTYSSPFIAVPLLLVWERVRKKTS